MYNDPIKQIATLSPALLVAYSDANLDARLHRFMLQIQKGQLLPESIPMQNMQRVLDLSCGTGEWIFDLAKLYPELAIYGIDINDKVLKQARERSDGSNLFRVQWRQMDALQSMPIPDYYLNLVHTRRSSSWLDAQRWSYLINDCARVLVPGGWVNLVELEIGELSSPAFMQLSHAMLEARARLGCNLDATGRTFGIATNLYHLLREAPFKEVGYDLHVIDAGFMSGNSGQSFIALVLRYMLPMRSHILQLGILDTTVFDALLLQMNEELQAHDLCGWGLIVSAYGQRCAR